MRKKTTLEEYLNMSWHFSIQQSEWEGEKGYWAWVSELPNCSSFASSQSKALLSVVELLPAYLRAAIKSKTAIPHPKSRESEADEVGGTIVLRLPKSLHLGLKQAAQAEKTSLNQFALFALTKMVCETTTPATSYGSNFQITATKKVKHKSP